MDIRVSPPESKEETPQYLLCHETITPEGNNKTSWDTNRLQLQFCPSEHFGESPRTVKKGTSKSGNDRETDYKIETDPQDQVAQE